MTHIAVDLDDVVLDFTGGLRASVKTEFGVELSPEDISQWDLHAVLDPIIGRSWWAWMKEKSWLWATFPAVDGAIGALDTLRRRGNYLELVTSKPQWAEANVYKWLGKWRAPFQRVTIVDKDTPKVSVTDAQIVVDDKLENCAEFCKVGRPAILFDRPHNRQAVWEPTDGQAFMYRCTGWPAVVRYIYERTI